MTPEEEREACGIVVGQCVYKAECTIDARTVLDMVDLSASAARPVDMDVTFPHVPDGFGMPCLDMWQGRRVAVGAFGLRFNLLVDSIELDEGKG